MPETKRCPGCGGSSPGLGQAGLCPSCLLGLALEAPDDPVGDDEPADPARVYRVLTVLASEPERTTYLAEQEGTRRLLTVDVVRAGCAGGLEADGLRQRLQALCGWSHPNVPRIVEARRTASGDYCVVAHYISGPPIEKFCRDRQIAGAGRARLFAGVCEAVSDGHRHGISHGRLRSDQVIVSAAGSAIVPIVLGYSIPGERVPTIGDDVAALEKLARAMGWAGSAGTTWRSMDELAEAVSAGWPETVPAPEAR